jgi:CheY-like chemotaxis protein
LTNSSVGKQAHISTLRFSQKGRQRVALCFQVPESPDLPVIIGSGRLDDSTAEDLKMLGVLHQLDKPYTQRMLAAMLAKVLTGAKAS